MLLDLLALDGPAPPTSSAATPPLAGLVDVDPLANVPFGNLSLDGGIPKGPPAVVDPFADLASAAIRTAAPAPTPAPGKLNL
jgi:hypothetical protein